MISIAGSGTLASVIGTEHTLGPSSLPTGAYELHVDAAAMLAGDTLELAIKEPVLAGGTVRRAAFSSSTGAIAAPEIKVVGPITIREGGSASLKQTAGTGRSYPWELRQVA